MSNVSSSNLNFETPSFPVEYIISKSNCSLLAPRSINNSNISSITSLGLAASLSILFNITRGFRPNSNDFLSTNFVCGIGPS